MTRCTEFYEKWDREPNWCEKCPEAVRQINNYLALCEELEARGIEKNTTNVALSEGSVRGLFHKRAVGIKDNVISEIATRLNREQERINKGFKAKKISSHEVSQLLNKETNAVEVKARPAQVEPDNIDGRWHTFREGVRDGWSVLGAEATNGPPCIRCGSRSDRMYKTDEGYLCIFCVHWYNDGCDTCKRPHYFSNQLEDALKLIKEYFTADFINHLRDDDRDDVWKRVKQIRDMCNAALDARDTPVVFEDQIIPSHAYLPQTDEEAVKRLAAARRRRDDR